MPPPDERIALVTGANRGIGLEVTRQLAARGWRVLLGTRSTAPAVPGAVEVLPLDVSDDDSVAAAGQAVLDRHGRLDVLVNNAAIHYDTWQRGVDADLTVVHEAMETNLFGAWRVTQAMLPALRRGRHRRIVNVSSEGGSLASMGGGTPAYSVSKAALNALTRVLAAELHPEGILVNAACPGWVATDMGGPGGRPVGEGAASVLWAVDLPDDGPTGGFFRDGHPVPW
ncbi:SDR family NAD(P)-dependent oxidoreductase [Dactylosporangium sp. NPDC005572]|uniref:SDR family NAD(P)-dependent oxidoreductase n=1 Tax=Dactylosporangium sp. NPDC005572 TaxID=3156889 RepID=UPI0033B1EE0C